MFRACFQHLAGIERRRIPPTPANELRLHRLERPEPWSWAVQDALLAAAKWEEVQQYPDYALFYQRVADFIGVSPQNIVVGAGIEEFIRTLVMLCCDPGDRVAFTYPTCAMFDIYARVFGAEAVHIETDPDKPPTAADITAMLRDMMRRRHPHCGVTLIILPNPGQPVDVSYDLDELRELAALCGTQGIVLAIDEAYHGFGAPTALPLIAECDNVVVLRTFSKAFGAASIRVGFAVGHERVIRVLDAARPSGEIAGPSMKAATVLMDMWDSHVVPGVAEIVAARDWLVATLQADGLKVRGTNANHALIDMGSPERAREIADRLKARGVNVRVNAPPVDRWLMVTCGGRELMERFYEVFKDAQSHKRRPYRWSRDGKYALEGRPS